jgi:glucans biosynthesis protein
MGEGRRTKLEVNPMLLDMRRALRCRARSKRSGKRCQSPAVRGFEVCRMHGARGGAPKGNRNALKHGLYTAEAIQTRRMIAALMRQARELAETV